MNILRTQVAHVVRRIAAEYAREMLEIQVEIARDTNAFPQDRLKATALVLDRAAGKPTQEVADEGVDPEAMHERIRQARASAGEVMNPALMPPSDSPMSGNVIDLRPNSRVIEHEMTSKNATSPIKRRRLIE